MKTDNELIAEFMGLDWKNSTWEWGPARYRPMIIEDLEHYQKNWNCLMPVVEKIERLNFDVQIGSGCFCRIWDIDSGRMEEIETSYPTKLEATYKAIVEFIKWYNEQKK